jgi:uncharacterized membrane protein YjjP (DUF1212 family)
LYHIQKWFEGQASYSVPGPTVTFGFIIATLFGAAFHLIFGGDARRLAVFLLSGWAGFALGHIIGVNFGISVLSIGSLRFLAACVGALAALLIARAMTVRQVDRRAS